MYALIILLAGGTYFFLEGIYTQNYLMIIVGLIMLIGISISHQLCNKENKSTQEETS